MGKKRRKARPGSGTDSSLPQNVQGSKDQAAKGTDHSNPASDVSGNGPERDKASRESAETSSPESPVTETSSDESSNAPTTG